MAVRIQKSSFNIREKLAELERPIGVNGAALMKAETPQESFSLIGAGRKNAVINGNFDVWQRGTTLSVAGAGGQRITDRFTGSTGNASGAATFSRQTVSSSDSAIFPSKYFYRHDQTTANGSNGRLGYTIENVHTFAGGYATLSFYAKSNKFIAASTTQLHAVCVQQFGTGGSPSTAINVSASESSTSTIPVVFGDLTTSWKKYSVTFYFPSVADKTLGTNNDDHIYFEIRMPNSSGTGTYTIDFSQFQFEQGKVATPFEHRSYGEELRLCQRYYYRFRCANQEWIYNESNASNGKWHQIYIGHSMRANPSVDVGNLATGGSIVGMTGVTISSITPQSPGDTPGRISSRIVMSGTAGSAYNLHHTDVWQNNYIVLSAEIT